MEKAKDSHYEISEDKIDKLTEYLYPKRLVAGMKEFLATNNESDFVKLLDKLGIKYKQFHYDYFD